jgi:hypothetical protein
MNQRVTVTILGEPDLPPFQALAVEMSGSGMRLLSPEPIPYQAAVRIEAGDLLLLGEVIRAQTSETGETIVLELRHSLHSVGDLRRLNEALCWENRRLPQSPERAPALSGPETSGSTT